MSPPHHFKDHDKQLIQISRQAGYLRMRSAGFDRPRDLLEALCYLGSRLPDRPFIVSKHRCQFLKIASRQNQPSRPVPVLIRSANSDIQNHPVEPAGPHIRQSYPMFLPRPRDRQIARLQTKRSIPDRKSQVPRFQKGQLDTFISVPFETPCALSFGIPESRRAQTRQGGSGQGMAGIRPTGKRLHTNLASLGRFHKRTTSIGMIPSSVFFVDHSRWHTKMFKILH